MNNTKTAIRIDAALLRQANASALQWQEQMLLRLNKVFAAGIQRAEKRLLKGIMTTAGRTMERW